MSDPLYSIGTWSSEAQAYLPHPDLPAFNITRDVLVQNIRALQRQGYSCHRYRFRDESGVLAEWSDDSDPRVFIGRTDGKPEADILKSWER